MFRKRKEKKWVRYKEKVKEVGKELELESWLLELIISTLEKEEENRELQEMAAWLEKLENDGRLPEDLEDEHLLLDIYKNHTSWVEKSVQFHIDARKDDNETFESLISAAGKPITSMPLEAQNAYLALWGEILNVIAQAISYYKYGGSSF